MYCNIIINRPFNQPFTYDVGSSKVKKELVAFELLDRGIPRTGYDIVNENDQ